MAKVTTGYNFGLDPKEATACRLLCEGKSEDDIIAVVMNVGSEASDYEKRKAKAQLHKWMKKPEFADCYRAIVKEMAMPAFGAAMARTIALVNDPQGWLALQAANTVFSRFGPAIMGDEDRQVVVKVEGMPTLGEPSTEEPTE